ncbi:hypothetical protein [Natroniella sp. ANB-PHB2]|uniref:hypothetical protein n=1 Tax=Natroniella sp. ANB-PHB2 TaxID=3384444 RepID=UPI0038D4EF9E
MVLSEVDKDKLDKRFINKVKSIKNEFDLSKDEDLSIALMHLISLEEHLYFSAMKTSNDNYIDYLKAIRELRKKLMKKIVVEPEGEEWCIYKHLLGSSMRLIEVGTKELGQGGKSNMYFESAFDLYSLFFSMNLKGSSQEDKPKEDKPKEDKPKEDKPQKKNLFEKARSLVREMVDCCIE